MRTLRIGTKAVLTLEHGDEGLRARQSARLSRFDVTLSWNSAPHGKRHESPGQRPGNRDSEGSACRGRAPHFSALTTSLSAVKNRILFRPHRARTLVVDVFPGRCPGLICTAPSGNAVKDF